MWCYCNILPCQINRHQRSPVTRIQTSCFFVWKLKTHHFLFIKCNKGATECNISADTLRGFLPVKGLYWVILCQSITSNISQRDTEPWPEGWGVVLYQREFSTITLGCTDVCMCELWPICCLTCLHVDTGIYGSGFKQVPPTAHSPQCESVIWCVTARLCCCVVVVCVKWVINKINSLFYIQLFKCLIQYPSGCP